MNQIQLSLLPLLTLISAPFSLEFANAQSESRRWPYEITIEPFQIQSDFQLADRDGLEEILRQLQSEIAEFLTLPADGKTIHLILFGSAEEYHRYMRHYFPSVTSRRAIFLQDRGPGMVFAYWHDEIATDLRHEVTHALLNRAGLRLPIWLDEGLAEYFEIPAELRFSGSPYLTSVAERASNGYVPSLEQLESIDQMSEFQESHYRDSWAWVHLLLHRRPETRQALVEYIHRIGQGISQPPLHEQLVNILENPLEEFQNHFKAFQDSRLSQNPSAVSGK